MRLIFTALLFVFALALTVGAQTVTVSPNSVNAYSQGATSVYLTFQNVVNLRPAEAVWCGEIISAAPDLGFRCEPTTIFGQLPARYNQSSLNQSRYTDIMSVTPTVARRAYTDAVRGNDARFFYVKHFVSTNGGPDQFVPVTIRLSGNGAGVPFSLTGVKLLWQDGTKVVPFIKPNEKLPQITAEIRYTGTGRLKGRWEIVKPGENLPDREDLLSEAALPPERRGTQRRYTLLSRFNVNLPPGGKFNLPGPENWCIDKTIEGLYLLLFRVEASDAGDSDSNVGQGVIPSGGVAGFQMPVLRYYVGNSSNADAVAATTQLAISEEVKPLEIILSWQEKTSASLYRVEIVDGANAPIFTAIVPATILRYQLPSFLQERVRSESLQWRVKALDANGQELETSPLKDLIQKEM